MIHSHREANGESQDKTSLGFESDSLGFFPLSFFYPTRRRLKIDTHIPTAKKRERERERSVYVREKQRQGERERGGEGGFFFQSEAFLLIKKEEPFGGLLRRAL